MVNFLIWVKAQKINLIKSLYSNKIEVMVKFGFGMQRNCIEAQHQKFSESYKY